MSSHARIGPTPESSVSVVPDAWTAVLIRLCDSFNWTSSRRTSSRSSSARSYRVCSTAVFGLKSPSSRTASEALSSLAIPPGDRLARAAWSRETTMLRSLPISWFRLARRRSTSVWSAGSTERRPGEQVLDVPATLASRVRVLGTGRSNKNDPNDALSVAIAALRSPGLRAVEPANHTEVLRLLAKRNHEIGRLRNIVVSRLHAALANLSPG